MNTPTCLILAGGQGTRIQPVIGQTPKCLAPIGDSTFLAIQIRALREAGISRICLSLGAHAAAVTDWLNAHADFHDISWIIESTPLVTGGAIAFAFRQLEAGTLLVTNGDTLIEADISPMLVPLSRETRELARMAVVQRSDRLRYGGVVIDSESRVTGFVEKGSALPGLVNCGMYLLAREVFEDAPTGPFSLETDSLPLLVANRTISACSLEGSFTDIGVPEDYFSFRATHSSRTPT